MNTTMSNRLCHLAGFLGLFAAGASSAEMFTAQPVDDAYLSNSGSEADQTWNETALQQFGYYGGVKRPLLKFDLSSIPDAATILSARLTITLQGIYGGQGHSTTVWRMPNDNWSETHVTWNSYDQTGAGLVSGLAGTNELGPRVWHIQLANWPYTVDLADDAVTFLARWDTDAYGGSEGDAVYKWNTYSSKEGTAAPTLQIEYIVESAPPPTLSITLADEQIIISWPSPADGWLLERSTQLAPGTWTPIPPPYSPGDGKWFVTRQRTGAPAAEFFRLYKP